MMIIVVSVFSACGEEEEEPLEFDENTTGIDYSKYAGREVKVFNWGYYISDGSDDSVDVNAEFEALTGIKVIYDTFDSNESLYAKLSGGGADYDVIIPSDYMIGRLIEEGYLAELDYSLIPNYEYVSDDYKNTEYDPENKFSVPYNVGMVGVIYNTEYVEEENPDSWQLLWDPKYKGKILNFNNPRDAFAPAQFLLGLSVNTQDKEDWENTYNKMFEQKQILQSYVMDEVFNIMESGEAWIAPYYAGDFFTMYGNNGNLAFYYPKEGTNLFIDAACVPKTSKNQDLAMLYINFLMDPEIAKANAEYMYYASPNTAVLEDEEYLEFLEELHPDAYDILYTSAKEAKTEIFLNLPDETKDIMNRKWTQLGAEVTEEGSDFTIYMICLVLAVIIAAYFIYKAIVKKKRSQYN